jgi:hypothetical protein
MQLQLQNPYLTLACHLQPKVDKQAHLWQLLMYLLQHSLDLLVYMKLMLSYLLTLMNMRSEMQLVTELAVPTPSF